ncbi:hypothetical protein MRB53_034871 [Persea americana]|uniref:Uncharacterized protein n=1 Tax=Persea americana TaxID=3435 RepID=A0ACC2K337_PERAE|nr:hypothetical protein MRB53_034871 [Persea americana]
MTEIKTSPTGTLTEGGSISALWKCPHTISFGAGRRACRGISFAIPTMRFALANLQYFFDWKMPNGMRQEDLDMSEAGDVIVCLRSAVLLIPVAHVF